MTDNIKTLSTVGYFYTVNVMSSGIPGNDKIVSQNRNKHKIKKIIKENYIEIKLYEN